MASSHIGQTSFAKCRRSKAAVPTHILTEHERRIEQDVATQYPHGLPVKPLVLKYLLAPIVSACLGLTCLLEGQLRWVLRKASGENAHHHQYPEWHDITEQVPRRNDYKDQETAVAHSLGLVCLA